MSDILSKKGLQWLGYVHRMENNRLPKQLLYSQLCEGKRKHGRPNLRFKDVIKRSMKSKNINTNTWQNTAQDKPAWKNTINNAT